MRTPLRLLAVGVPLTGAAVTYNGEVPYYCDGDTFAWGGSDAAMTCSMNGGA